MRPALTINAWIFQVVVAAGQNNGAKLYHRGNYNHFSPSSGVLAGTKSRMNQPVTPGMGLK